MPFPKQASVIAIALGALLLAACEDQKTAQAPSPSVPAPVEPAQPPAPPSTADKSASETAKEGLDKLREAATKAVEEMQPALDKARNQADQLLKDAQPHIDKARETAKQLGQSIDVIIQRAQEDINKAAEALDQKMREAGNVAPPVPGDLAASLSSAEKLRADTRAAARAGGTVAAPPYVGAWAVTAPDCAKIDQSSLDTFAVVTPTSLRDSDVVCNIAEPTMSNGVANTTGQCITEVDEEPIELSFRMSSPDRLSISTPGTVGRELVRCHLPG